MTQSPDQAGWYDDPDDPEQLQYFDGIVWSGRRVPKKAPVRVADVTPSPQTDPRTGRPAPAPMTWRHESGYAPRPPASVTASVTASHAADGRELAGFGLRLASGVVDLLVVSALSLLVSGWAWYLWMADYWAFAWDKAQAGDTRAVESMSPDELVGFFDFRWFAVALLLTALVASAYHLVMLARRGQTLGKMATGTLVRRVGVDGPLGWGVAARRVGVTTLLWVLCMVPVISWFALPTLVVDHLMPLADKGRQTGHDKVAGTEVVRR